MPSARGKEIPHLRISQGKTRNKGREGKTYQKVPSEWEAIFSESAFSPYIQIIPITEMRGKDAIKLPSKGNFLEISEIRTIRIAERTTLIRYQIISDQSFPSPDLAK